MNDKLKEIYELNGSLLQLAENLYDELFIKRGITPSEDLALLRFFFIKAYKTAKAVVFLFQEGYPEDAFVLVRTIFEILVNSCYVFESDSTKRARAFENYGKFRRKNKIEIVIDLYRKKMIENKEFEEELKKLEAECNNLEKDYQISEAKALWHNKNLEDRSRDVGLVDLYNTLYHMCSLYCHSSWASSRSFFFETDKGWFFGIKPDSDEELSELVLISLFDLFIRMVQEFDHRFELGYQNKISDLRNSLQNLCTNRIM